MQNPKPLRTPTHILPPLAHKPTRLVRPRPRLRPRLRLPHAVCARASAQTKYGLLDSLSKYAYTKGGEFDAPGTDDSHGNATLPLSLTLTLTLTLIRNLP